MNYLKILLSQSREVLSQAFKGINLKTVMNAIVLTFICFVSFIFSMLVWTNILPSLVTNNFGTILIWITFLFINTYLLKLYLETLNIFNDIKLYLKDLKYFDLFNLSLIFIISVIPVKIIIVLFFPENVEEFSNIQKYLTILILFFPYFINSLFFIKISTNYENIFYRTIGNNIIYYIMFIFLFMGLVNWKQIKKVEKDFNTVAKNK